MASADPVPAIVEAQAEGPIALIFADIRRTLGVEVVNLIWRHLATMPGALAWAWCEVKPLYQGAAAVEADEVRRTLALPMVTAFSEDVLAASGIDESGRSCINAILDSYFHTNALALVALSSVLARHGGGDELTATTGNAARARSVAPHPAPAPAKLPRLTPLAELDPAVARLIAELNAFGEDKDFTLVASMYRHLSHWPAYLALVRTLLAPLQASGELQALVDAARRAGHRHGAILAPLLAGAAPPEATRAPAIIAIRRFVEHPIARMTGICALMRDATLRVR